MKTLLIKPEPAATSERLKDLNKGCGVDVVFTENVLPDTGRVQAAGEGAV